MVASDHLPVLMVFNNPFAQPFALTAFARSNQDVVLTWQSVPGQSYRVEASADFTNWLTLADDLQATNGSFTFGTNFPASVQFFRVKRLN